MLLKALTTALLLLSASSVGASAELCTVAPTMRDTAQGLAIVTDASCADRSGVGCITTNCRYCLLQTTPSHDNLLMCSDVVGSTPTPTPMSPPPHTTDACALAVSPGDLSAGVSAATDPSCATGGLGCFSATCRFCSVLETALSASFLPCSAVTSSLLPPPPAFDLTCRKVVSSGDAAVGIDVVTDVSCTLGGVGCLSDLCRFCQVWTSEASQSFVPCSAIDTNDGNDIFFTPIPAPGRSNGIAIASTDRPTLDQIVFDVPAPAPSPAPPLVSPTTAPTTATTTAPTIAPAPAPTTAPTPAPPTADPCAASVSEGDAAVGISAASDSSCQFGGLGCFSPSCRFCKLYDTLQSSFMLACASLRS